MLKAHIPKYYQFLLFAAFILIPLIPSHSNIVQPNNSIIKSQGASTSEDLIRGERLFYGLVYPENKSMNCVSCHNTVVSESDTMNWNPDAVEISGKYINKSVADLSEILLNPTGQKIGQAHKNFQFTPEEVMLMKAYMDRLPDIGLKQNGKVITNLILFIIASFLLVISIIDLIITKRVKKHWITLAILSATAIYITWILVVDAIALGRSTDYSPDQPIKFSHQVHAGQNEINCLYCHSYAPDSKTAGIPAQNVCMNCHLLVRNGTRSGMFEIAKVVSSYNDKTPIEWIKVYNLPDHVFFNHAQHVSIGRIACTECHADVANMTRIIQVSDLSMGWCISCHRTRKVNFQDNAFYSQYKELTDKMRKGDIDSATVERLGGTECIKCHY
jgi:hypothetical protein